MTLECLQYNQEGRTGDAGKVQGSDWTWQAKIGTLGFPPTKKETHGRLLSRSVVFPYLSSKRILVTGVFKLKGVKVLLQEPNSKLISVTWMGEAGDLG